MTAAAEEEKAVALHDGKEIKKFATASFLRSFLRSFLPTSLLSLRDGEAKRKVTVLHYSDDSFCNHRRRNYRDWRKVAGQKGERLKKALRNTASRRRKNLTK